MRSLVLISALALAGVPAQAAGEAGELFAKRCATCHTVPDPAIKSDLAWLDQVNRTS